MAIKMLVMEPRKQAITFLMRREGLNTDQINELLTKRSDLFGISGLSGDMWEIEQKASLGEPRCQLAVDEFVHSVRKLSYELLCDPDKTSNG